MSTSPNGRFEVRVQGNAFQLWDYTRLSSQPIQYIERNDAVLSLSDDAQWVYLARTTAIPSLKVLHVNLRTGATELVTEVTVTDLTGAMPLSRMAITPDGKTLVFGYVRQLSELYLMQKGN